MTLLSKPPPVTAAREVASIRLSDLTAPASEDPMASDELTNAEVARELKVSPATVRRWHEQGHFKATRVLPSGHRRYSPEAVAAFKKQLAGEPPEQASE